MSEKMILPTDAMVVAGHEAGEIMQRAGRSFGSQCRWAIYAALNHPDAPGLLAAEWKANAEAAAERAERAEDLLVDSVHVDEAARRVEAAREQGWDQAVDWIDSYQGGPNGRTSSARSANPYRPAPTLPTTDGAVIVPADGHEVITMVGAGGWAFDRLTYSAEHDRWYGMTKRGAIAMCLAEQITPGTWKVDDQ